MEAPISFAPLAGRLAAAAAKIRPVDGLWYNLSDIMALFWCAILEMLISLCHALDARAAADAARLLLPSRDVEAGCIPALRAAGQAPSSQRRAPRLTLVPAVQSPSPKSDDAPCGTTERPAPATPWLAWSRDPGPIRAVHAPPWHPRRETKPFTPTIKHAYVVTIS